MCSTMLSIARLASQLPMLGLGHLRLEDTLKQFAAPLKEQVRQWRAGEITRQADEGG